MPDQIVFLIPLAGIGAMVVLGLPLIRAVVRYLERKSGAGSSEDLNALRSDVEDLRSRLDRTEENAARLTELEERLDFAERLLAQQRDRAALGRGEPEAP